MPQKSISLFSLLFLLGIAAGYLLATKTTLAPSERERGLENQVAMVQEASKKEVEDIRSGVEEFLKVDLKNTPFGEIISVAKAQLEARLTVTMAQPFSLLVKDDQSADAGLALLRRRWCVLPLIALLSMEPYKRDDGTIFPKTLVLVSSLTFPILLPESACSDSRRCS